MRNVIRRGVSLVILVLIPVLWWMTVSPWYGCVFSVRRAVFSVLGTVAGIVSVYFLLGSKSTKEKGKSIVLAVGSLIFCLMLLESPVLLFGVNYEDAFRTLADNTDLDRGVNKPDPILIEIHWPNSSFSGEVAGNLVQMGIPTTTRYRVNVHYDRNGFRNNRDFQQADIAVIGDSFVEAPIIAREKSLVGLLESRLSVPTVNLGQIGYGLRQELEVLKRFALPLSPKLVLWVLFGGNDLRDVEWYEQHLSHFNEPKPPVPFVQKSFLRNALVAGHNLIGNAIKISFQCPSEYALTQSGMFKRSDGVTERLYFEQPDGVYTPHAWQVAVDTLREAHRLAMESGAEFVVVYIPRKHRVYRSHISVPPDHAIAQWKVNNLPEELGNWCMEHGIMFVDTTPFLETQVAKGVHPYFVDDVHWNELGHETAAQAIIGYLSAEHVFPFHSGGPALPHPADTLAHRARH